MIQSEKQKIKSFKDLIVWQKALQLFVDINKDFQPIGDAVEKRIIKNQIIRSSSSISANIAEGYGRYKGKEFQRFLIIARGSTSETQDWLIKSEALGLINKSVFNQRLNEAEEIIKIINAILTKIRD